MDESLLSSLAQNPDPGALRVYADRVLEQGDVHGEFITLQLNRDQGTEPTAREESLRREVLEPALRKAVGRALIGCSWEQGFLDTVEFDVDEVPIEGLTLLAKRAEARLLRQVVFKALRSADERSLSPLWEGLQHSPRFPLLEAVSTDLGVGLGSPRVGAVEPLYRAYPQLKVLALHGVGHELGEIELPELTHFSASLLAPNAIAPLVAASWPKLEELELEFGEPAAEEVEPLFAPLVQAPMSSRLKRVKVKSPWPDYFRAALPLSPLGRGRIVEV